MKPLSLAALVGSVLAIAGQATAQPPIETLPAILHLQLDQRPAWRAYKDATAAQAAEAVREAGRIGELNEQPTPARLDALRRRMAAQDRAFEAQAEATEDFYSVLSPDQRRIFDQVTRVPASPSPMSPGGRSQNPLGPPLQQPPGGAGLPPPG